MAKRLLFSACVALCFSACTGTIADPAGLTGAGGAAGRDPGAGGGGAAPTGGATGTGATGGASGTTGTGATGGAGNSGGGSGGASTGGTGGATGGSAGAGGSGGGVDPCQSGTTDTAPSTMQLLTRPQYVNTVHDLLGSDIDLESVLPPGHDLETFGLVQGNVAQVDLENYLKASEAAATSAVATQQKLDALAPCAANADKRGCARTFVQTFGARAYRAPVSDAADIDRHLVVYDIGATTSYAHGIEMVLRAMLQAPRFLYRVEPGTAEKVGARAVKLTGYEIATRLSYAVWNTMPDPKLTAAAAAGNLSTKEGVAKELAWMIQDPRGTKAVRRFLEGWIHLNSVQSIVKDKALFPDWANATVRAQVATQAQTFFDDVLGSGGAGKLSALFTRARSDGSGQGMLTLPALLGTLATARESSPIYRGKFVREQLLCQELPAPPPNIPKPPDPTPGVSTRERFRQHEVDPACSTCHRLMDPIGFGFEHYDAIGRYRTIDNGAPVDASGEVLQTREINGKFVGTDELSARLSTSAEVQECVARQWFRYFLSRFEQNADSCSMKRIVDQFRAAGNDLNALPLALIGTDAFLYRRPVDEVTP
ncbi:MAG: DUF1588 domain-containing protein [Polyangiaceae bacterium]